MRIKKNISDYIYPNYRQHLSLKLRASRGQCKIKASSLITTRRRLLNWVTRGFTHYHVSLIYTCNCTSSNIQSRLSTNCACYITAIGLSNAYPHSDMVNSIQPGYCSVHFYTLHKVVVGRLKSTKCESSHEDVAMIEIHVPTKGNWLFNSRPSNTPFYLILNEI